MSHRVRLTALVLAATAVWLAAAPGAGAQPPALAFGRCTPAQVFLPEATLQCATLVVPFDRSEPSRGSVALAVQRLPPAQPRRGTIVLLAGGPGQPAIPAFEEFLVPLSHEPALRGFELVALDPRGTGQSEGLQCLETGTSSGHGLASYLGECGAALGLTRAFYTSQESVEDLEALRQALGGTPLSLLAVSYGGRVAAIYAREHPQGVARMVLDSPTPPAGTDPLGRARLAALRRVLDEGICGAGACRSFSADIFADLSRLVAKLHRHPLHTRIYDARGRLQPVSVTEAELLGLLSGLDLSGATRELAPGAIAAAAHGYAVPLARLAGTPESPLSSLAADGAPLGMPSSDPFSGESAQARAPAEDAGISLALFAATFCDESQLPWAADSLPAGRPAALRAWLAAQPAAAFAPFAASTLGAGAAVKVCIDWPATPPAPPSPTGVSAVPTLLLSGDDDLRTPYEQTLAVAAAYSGGQLLRIPDTGHSTITSDPTGCARRAMIEFLTAGQAPAACPASSEPQALALPPSGLGPAPNGRLAAKVANAAVMTIQDLLGQTGPAGGGLRGGRWARHRNGFLLHGMVDVDGVALSGTVRVGATPAGALEISGRLAVRGRMSGKLVLHDRALSGRLGGTPVHARFATL